MHSLRLGLALIATGVAVPLVCLPVLDGYVSQAGVLGNIQDMTFPITRDKMEPDFREVASLASLGGLLQAEVEGTTVGFPDSIARVDMLAALNAEPQFQRDKERPKFMRFYGWTIARHGVLIPFNCIASFGLLVAFAGSILLVWNVTGRGVGPDGKARSAAEAVP